MVGETVEKEMPKRTRSSKSIPEIIEEKKELPEVTDQEKELPSPIKLENAVYLGEEWIEIKPTKLKYQRDRTAAFYRILDVYPLPDILAFDKGVLDENRDGDKCLFDWLIAVFNDSNIVVKYYDNMDSAMIYKLLEIFKRLNGIQEKEDEAKNRAAKATNR